MSALGTSTRMVSPFSTSTLSPMGSATNHLNKTTRDQQERLYCHEYEKSFYNRYGPGPSYYTYENTNSGFNKDKNKFSIPKVSTLILTIFACRVIERYNYKNQIKRKEYLYNIVISQKKLG